MSWTDERIERLKSMWTNGSTASQIAEDLGGVSRNAVIGKAHRLGLEARPSPVKAGEEKAKAKKVAAPKPAPVAAAAVPLKPAPAARAKDRSTASRRCCSRCCTGRCAAWDRPQIPARAAARPSARRGPDAISLGRSRRLIRQGPGDTQAPIPPAPPRRLVPAKPSPEVADKTSLLELNDRICRWPMGHPGEPDFHFCGQASNPGFPYCVQHCGVAYQAQLPRRDRRPPPPLPFGGPRVR